MFVDPEKTNRIALTTLSEIYLSQDSGMSWNRIPLRPPYKSAMVITSIALSSNSMDSILIGTSFSGIFETQDRGKTWTRLTNDTHPIYQGAGFYEEITDLAYAPTGDSRISFTTGFDEDLYFLQKNRGEDNKVELLKNSPGYRKHPEKLAGSISVQKLERLAEAEGKYGIYLNSYSGKEGAFTTHLDFLQDHAGNAVVIDMKDDLGYITYNSGLQLPKDIGAVTNRLRLEELIEEAHERDIYVIGRIVVFQDPLLYAYNKSSYAVWNFENGSPWGNMFEIENPETREISLEQREFWVDPYCEAVWDYNIQIARELEERGIDEIQFDYIRFPTEGDFSAVQYRYRKEGMKKTDAIESFLSKAREQLSIPISVDIFGFNGWYRMGNWNGQNIELIARYADVICPMYYPSHFPGEFLGEKPYLIRGGLLYSLGTLRAKQMVAGSALIRPYVQAFLIGGELNFEEPEYTGYLEKQIDGIREADGDGFILWNASNRYYMVKPDLKLSFH